MSTKIYNPADDPWVLIRGTTNFSELARQLDISRPTIYGWLRAGLVPAERVIQIEAITGIPRERLRPDLYREASDVQKG